VTGIVTDPSRSSVPGAEVTLTDVDRAIHSTGKTDAEGRYLFRSQPPGNYALEVHFPRIRNLQAAGVRT
jgi:hypothetical protein